MPKRIHKKATVRRRGSENFRTFKEKSEIGFYLQIGEFLYSLQDVRASQGENRAMCLPMALYVKYVEWRHNYKIWHTRWVQRVVALHTHTCMHVLHQRPDLSRAARVHASCYVILQVKLERVASGLHKTTFISMSLVHLHKLEVSTSKICLKFLLQHTTFNASTFCKVTYK